MKYNKRRGFFCKKDKREEGPFIESRKGEGVMVKREAVRRERAAAASGAWRGGAAGLGEGSSGRRVRLWSSGVPFGPFL